MGHQADTRVEQALDAGRGGGIHGAMSDSDQRTLALLWGERGEPRRGPKPSLTRARIAASASAIADAEGLDAISMQRVARASGVSTMALYRYVPGKAELIALMLDIGLGAPPPLAGAPGDWRAQLEDWARRLWVIFQAHPWSLAATMPPRVMGPHELAWFEAAMSALAETGLRADEAARAVIAILLHVRGMASSAPSSAPEGAGDRLGRSDQESAIISVLRAHGSAYPALSAAWAAGAFGGPSSEDLEFGLRLLLDGLAARIAARA